MKVAAFVAKEKKPLAQTYSFRATRFYLHNVNIGTCNQRLQSSQRRGNTLTRPFFFLDNDVQ